MSGYPSGKIMWITWGSNLNIETFYEQNNYHFDKFSLNSNYLVAPAFNKGAIEIILLNNPMNSVRQMFMPYTGGITDIANFAYTAASDYFLCHSKKNKLYLFDFGANPAVLIREYPATLNGATSLVYV